MKELTETKWYSDLINDLKKLEFTGVILTKWHIGKRILEEFEKFGKPQYGSRRIENIAKDLNVSLTDLKYCILFAKKVNAVDQLKGKSWHWVVNTYLPEPKETTEEQIIQEQRLREELKKKGKYQIIYADPPWNYFAGGYKNQNQHYDSLTMDKLAELPIQDLTAEDCILFLWSTFPILPEAINLIDQWGFEYSTVGFIWVKSNKSGKGFFFGLGNWTRSNVELCLIATKGSIARKDASISQIIYEPIREHSRKPDTVRKKIVQLVGDLPRIELFAREAKEGFEVWGNEINKFNVD